MQTPDVTETAAPSIAETLAKLGADDQKGLSSAEVQERLKKYGPNALIEKQKNALAAVLEYFWGPMPWMIEAAALMAFIVGDWGDFAIITSLLLFNALLGFWEEHEASNALEALKGSLALKARALRDGNWQQIDARTLVPGDIVRLYLGDVVPADCTLIAGDYISIDQSALTGESLPVSKKSGEEAYSGSIVKQGEMTAVVTATGANTFFGRTAKLVAGAGSVSHFQRAVMRIGNFLIILALVLVVILVAARLFDMRGHYDRAVLLRLGEIVLILLVASVPVAMPAVLSVTMALGARLLAKRKAIVSRLEAIEELAGVDVLCSDKTGTLTENKLTLGEAQPWTGTDADTLILMASLASRAADNDPIDLAILAGLKDQSVLKTYQQQAYVPFDPVHKRTEATIKESSGEVFRVSKGAPQVILSLTKLAGTDLVKAQKTVNDFASHGYRTIGVAVAHSDDDWAFLGILPLFDPPRPDSKSTIERARAYGVKVKMVTGDNVAIARQIASELDMGTNIQPATDLFPGDVTKGQIPLDATEKIDEADGFAEVFPEHKYAIVKILQQNGHIVGMTGDGVNDAPALKKADIGVAMGIKGTEVTKEAAGMILADDNFASITAAVKEGRTVYNNIEKAMLFLLPTNVAQALVIAVAIFFGFTMPITAPQVLWVNMVTSVALGLVISFEPHEIDVMSRPPRAIDRPIVTGFGIWRIVFVGLALLAYTLLAFFWMKSQGASDELARTVAVNAITIGQVFYLLNSRYLLESSFSLSAHMGNKYLPLGIGAVVILQLLFTYAPPFQAMFGNQAIPLWVWPWLIAGGLLFFVVVEAEKLVIRSSDALRTTVTAVEAGT
jgi:H+-transporting ATPase